MYRSPAGLLAVLLCLCWCAQHRCRADETYTHKCSLVIINGSLSGGLNCTQPATHPACHLVAYYNSSAGFGSSIFGVNRSVMPTLKLPSMNATRAGTPTMTAKALGLVIGGDLFQPLLLLHGGSKCNVLLEAPVIQNVALPRAYQRDDQPVKPTYERQVVAVGGGVRVTFKNALIANNVADSVVAVLPNSEVTVTGSTCRDNTVLFGVVYVNGHLMLNNTTLSGNFAHLAGAGVCGDNGIVDIHQSNFTHNTARGAGGAAAFFSTRAKLREVYFTLNTAAGGGAVVLQDGNMTSDKCWFLNNTAGGNFTVPALRVLPFRTVGMGGAMLARDSNITMRTCELLFNYADREGGALALFNDKQGGHAELVHAIMEYNSADQGGGIRVTAIPSDGKLERLNDYYAGASPALTVNHSRLAYNQARSGSGGCILIRPGAFTTISNSSFTNCTADNIGGGISTASYGDEPQVFGKTQLKIDADFADNIGTGRHIWAGPFFTVTFPNKSRVNESTPGVLIRKSLCGMGEYQAPSGYCERCGAYTYSLAPESQDVAHNLKTCLPAPNNTYAPGGAVFVPKSRYWHDTTALNNTSAQVARAEEQLKGVRRCYNPTACTHNVVELARQHPYNTTTKKSELLDWSQYGARLCSAKKGYTGPFCGVCMEGYGATAPFTCERCFGAQFNSTGTVTKTPTRVGISLMYVLYWFIGMVVTLYTVWSAFSAHYHATHDSGAPAQPADSTTAALADCDRVQADKTDPEVSVTVLSGTDSVSCQGSIPSSASSSPKDVSASPMDIIKALWVYYNWANLIRPLPIEWMPAVSMLQAPAAATAVAQASSPTAWQQFKWVVAVALGNPSSLDCLFQSWDLWPGSDYEEVLEREQATFIILRTFIRALVVPIVMLLTVMAVQAVWYKVGSHVTRWILRPERLISPLIGLLERFFGTLVADARRKAGNASNAEPFAAYLWDHLAVTLVVIFFSYYQTFAKSATGLLMCVDLGSEQRWVLDVRLSCPAAVAFQPKRGWAVGALVLGAFILAVFCIGPPVLFARALLRQASAGGLRQQTTGHIDDTAQGPNSRSWVAERLAYRYRDYAIDNAKVAFWTRAGWKQHLREPLTHFGPILTQAKLAAVLCWDSVLDLFRFQLVVVSMSVMLHELHQLLAMAMLFGCYLVLILMVRPWKSPTTQRLQVAALLVLVLSCCGIIACSLNDAGSYYANDSYRKVIPWVVLGLNAFYVVAALGVLVRCTVRVLREAQDGKNMQGSKANNFESV